MPATFYLSSMLPKSLSRVLILCFFADVFKLLTIPAVKTIWQTPCKGPSYPKLKPMQLHKSPFCEGLRPFLAEFQIAVHTPCNSLHPTPHVSNKMPSSCGNTCCLNRNMWKLLRTRATVCWIKLETLGEQALPAATRPTTCPPFSAVSILMQTFKDGICLSFTDFL